MDLTLVSDYLHKHNSGGGFSCLAPEEYDAASQLVQSARIFPIHGVEVTIASVVLEAELRNFSAMVQSLMDEKEWPVFFALGGFGSSVVVVRIYLILLLSSRA